jgi:hypothetical protein
MQLLVVLCTPLFGVVVGGQTSSTLRARRSQQSFLGHVSKEPVEEDEASVANSIMGGFDINSGNNNSNTVLEHGRLNAKEITFLLGRLNLTVQLEIDDLLDIDKMVEKQQLLASENVQLFQNKVDSMKPELDAARDKFKACRQTIRANYKNCKKMAKKHKKTWKSKSVCTPFAAHFIGVQVAKARTMEQKMKQLGRRRRRRKADRAAKCAKKPTCELRMAKLMARDACKGEYKVVRSSVREYKKELRKAKFMQNILPKIILLLKPPLLAALSEMDMGEGGTALLRVCTEEQEGFCIPLDQIRTVDLLKKYITIELNAVVWPYLYTKFKDMISPKVWQLVDPAKDTIKTSLVTAIGTIPIVGGMLAAAIGMLMEALYTAAKNGVEKAFDKMMGQLQVQLVTAIVDGVFATGLFTDERLQDLTRTAELISGMQTVADAAQKLAEMASQTQLTSQANAVKALAEEKAAEAESSIQEDGAAVKDAEEADDQEEAVEIEEQDATDITDDDEL